MLVTAGLLLLLTASFLSMSDTVDHNTEELVYAKPGTINSLMEIKPTYEFKVLITGYEAWGNMSSNPCQKVATHLNETCERVFLKSGKVSFNVCYEGLALPVTEQGASRVAEALQIDPYKWDAIILLGVWPHSDHVRLEVAAANVKANNYANLSAEVPCDKNGTKFEEIVPSGPCLLPTTAGLQYLDIADLFYLLSTHGIENADDMVVWSRDAGSFFCNEAFYRTVHEIRSRAPSVLTPVLFIHLPEEDVLDVGISKSVLVAQVGLA